MISRRAAIGGAIGVALTPKVATADASARPPVIYVSHGSPLFGGGDPGRRDELRAWGARIARPRGIVIMTPHFASRRVELGRVGRGVAMYNLPGALRRRIPPGLEYATPPSDAIAARVEQLLGAAARADRAGFDHTTWMPLKCLFPAADVPVLELAYPYVSEAESFAFGKKLAPLRDEGILFVASGGMTHNLASVDLSRMQAAPPAWSRDFDAWAAETITKGDVDALVGWRGNAPAASLAHPDDGAHYRVLIVALGVALGSATSVTFPMTGFEGTLSKRCVELR